MPLFPMPGEELGKNAAGIELAIWEPCESTEANGVMLIAEPVAAWPSPIEELHRDTTTRLDPSPEHPQ